MSDSATIAVLTELMNAAGGWENDDQPLEVVLMAKDAGIPQELINEAARKSTVDFDSYE